MEAELYALSKGGYDMKLKKATKKSIKLKAAMLAICLSVSGLAGCGGASPYDEFTAAADEEIGFDTYEDTKDAAEIAEAEVEDDAEDDAGTEENASGAAEDDSAGTKEETGTSPLEGKDKKLVYEGSVAIDAIEFETAVGSFKETVQKFGGFLENEQSYGAGGDYASESSYGKEEPRTFRATARIPSDSYQEFMEQTEGLGKVTESNSQVTNMTRQYGTLKAELEIYEAEYARYLKMFDEVSEDKAMLAIQEKLTELSLNIARTKSEMSVIDTDASYSIVNIHISEVAVYEESATSFPQRLGDVLAKSWKNMLKFFENLLFFFILHWYKLLLLFLIIWLIVKFVKKQQAKSEQRRQQMMQSYQNGQRRQGGVQPGTSPAPPVQSQMEMNSAPSEQPQVGTNSAPSSQPQMEMNPAPSEQPQVGTTSIPSSQSQIKAEEVKLSEAQKEEGSHHE